MAQPNYKFKPYAPIKLKKKKDTGEKDVEKSIKSLEKQRDNLNKRLLAEGIDPETLGGEFDNRNIIEKALNLKPDQGLLMDFFEVIDRPVQAVKQGLLFAKNGNNAMEGFVHGLAGTGKEISGSEFLKAVTGIEPQGGLAKFATDVAADIALDPLTYLPPGILAKGLSKLGKIGGKTVTIEGAEIAAKLSTKIDEVVKLVNAGDADALKKVMSIDEIEEFIELAKEGLKGGAAEELADRQLNELLRDTGLDELKDKFKILDKGTVRGTAAEGLRNTKDLSVMFEFEPGRFVEVSKVEVKDLLTLKNKGKVNETLIRGSAFGLSSAIGLEDVTSGASDTIKKTFLDIAGDVSVTVGDKTTTMRGYIEDLIKSKKTGSKSIMPKRGGLKIGDKAKVEEALKAAFFADLKEAGVDFVSFRYGSKGDKILTISRETLEKTPGLLGIASAQIGTKSAGGVLKKANIATIGQRIADQMPPEIAETVRNIFKSKQVKFIKNFPDLKVAKGKKGKQFGDFIVANSNPVIDLSQVPTKQRQQILDALQNVFEIGTQRINISSVGDLGDGRYVFKTSAQEGGKASRDLIAGIDLVDEAGKPLTEEALDLLDESDAFKKMFLTPGPKQKTTTTQFLTLMGRARSGEFDKISPYIKKVADSLKKFEIDFKLTFNLTAGFDDQTKALLRKAYGGDMFQLERRSAKLAEIKKKLIEIDPDAGVLVGELIEADAKIIDGKIVKLKRHIGTSDFFDYMYNLITKGDGGRMAIPQFTDAVTEKTFIDTLQEIYRKATSGATDIVFSIKKGKSGSKVLAFAGDAREMRDLIDYIKNAPTQIQDYLRFGEKKLSQKAKAFLRNNLDEINKYRDLTNELLDDLVNVAGFKNMPQELQKQIGYMRHTISKEAMEGLRKQMPGVLSLYAKPGKNTLGNRNLMGSVQEINAVMRDFFGISDDFFDPNAFNAMEDFITQVSRKMDQKQVLDIILSNKGVDGSDLFKVVDNTQEAKAAMSNYDVMIKDFKEDFSSLYNNLSDESKELFDEFLTKNGYGKDKAIQINKSAYNVLKGVEKAYFDVPKLAQIYDGLLNMWKGLTLITPGFHLRNLFGNMFNSYAVGMDVFAQGKYLGLAMQEMDQFQKIGKKMAQGLDITDAEQAIFDTVRGYFDQGVSQTHRGIRDLEGVMEASAQTAKKGTIKNTYNNVVRFNFNVAEKIDDVQRYALYRWSLDKTGDGVKAANTVAEALFDYSHLTPFEKSYMKRLFPFYTFMKNNFVFQMKNIFKNPAQYAKVGRAYKYAIEDLGGYSVEDLPDYATENMWIPLPWTVDKNDKNAVAFLKATLPVADFTELVENPFKKGVTSITAPLKLLIEFGAGKDLFTGQPLEAFPGQTSAMPEETGVLTGLRDRRGNFTISQSPLFIKIMNDLGLRAPINIASTGLDLVDTLAGYQGGVENIGDFLQRTGIASVSEMDRLKLSRLYQDLERLRELKKFYEQETGNQLPVLPRG